MAEGLFIDIVAKAGLSAQFQVDSAGTSAHHEGELADSRMRQTAKAHGIDLVTQSRPLRPRDFEEFDYILTMDRSVHRSCEQSRQLFGRGKAQILRMRDFDPQPDSADVPDPYYGGPEGFETVYQILLRSNAALLAHIRLEKGI